MDTLEDVTVDDILEACRHMHPAWAATAHHSGRRADLLALYDARLDQWLELTA